MQGARWAARRSQLQGRGGKKGAGGMQVGGMKQAVHRREERGRPPKDAGGDTDVPDDPDKEFGELVIGVGEQVRQPHRRATRRFREKPRMNYSQWINPWMSQLFLSGSATKNPFVFRCIDRP